MRTRFLGTDCSASSAPIEALEFLRCSPPDLPPTVLSITEPLQHCFDDVSLLDVYVDVEKLPIENSISKFLSDVLPQIIDVEIGDFTVNQSDAGTACFDARSSGYQHIFEIDSAQKNCRMFSEEKGVQVDVPDSETLQFQKKGEKDFALEGMTGGDVVQFEVPEQTYDLLYQMGSVNISESLCLANEVDMPAFELRQQEFLDMQHSIYAVDSLLTDYFVEQKADILEDSGFTSEKVGSSLHDTFFILEIDEASLGISNNISIMDELISFEDIESEKCTQEDELMITENGSFREFDLLVHLSNHCLPIQSPELQVPFSNYFEIIDLIDDSEDSLIRHVMSSYLQTTDHISVSPRSRFLYEEFQFIDPEQCSVSQLFCDLATEGEVEALDELFGEATTFRSFDELIVLHELTLMDDSFKSLPAPVLSNSQNIGSLLSFVEENLNELELESSSMFDGLYLDWHILEEDNCNSKKHFCCWEMLQEIDMYSISSSLNTFDNETMAFNFLLSDDTFDKPNTGESKEVLNISHGLPVAPLSVSRVASEKLVNNYGSKAASAEKLSEFNAEVSESVESLTQFNDANIFVNPGNCTRGELSNNSNLSPDAFPVNSSSGIMDSNAITEVTLRQSNVKMYKIKLSDEIVRLVDHFKRIFLDILENNKKLVDNHYPSLGMDDIYLLRIPKEKLMHQIMKAGVPGSGLPDDDESIISLVTLWAIKQMTSYLCYYGVHTTYLYIMKLTKSMECLKCKLNSIQSLIGNICLKAERDITKFHPSLSVIKELLQSKIVDGGKKFLIVADHVFWWPLKKLLTSMNICYDQPQTSRKNKDQQDEFNDISDATSIIFQSYCCLVSHEYVATSFPFDKFGTILEYGGSCELPRILTMLPKPDNYHLYFVKVELEDMGAPKALCDGVDIHNKFRSIMKDDPCPISVLKVEELLNFMPVEENCGSSQLDGMNRDTDEAFYKMREDCVSFNMESNIFHQTKPSLPDIVIIVNTQNFDKEMLISRRSTYQKILLMEKEGAQVVERDLNLPVDILVNAKVCLAWYDLKNIEKKSSAVDEAFSCLPLCIENVAASVLTSLSFAFTSCILIFEGEKSYIAGVMESSDELYAAAASLGIDFQIFCSYSSDMTDEIIVSCIKAANKAVRGLYPKMPESETLAESFLTAFPSINPLSAHSILSSGVLLVEFLEWSCNRRIQAVRKYKIPDESVALLSLLSKHGEREDSKSAVTDSSSLESYTPDMQNCQRKSNSHKMKRKLDENCRSIDMHANGSLIELPNQFSDDRSIFSGGAGSNDFWSSLNSEIIKECGKPSLSTGDKLFGYEDLDVNMPIFNSKISSLYDCFIAESHLPSEETKKTQIHGNVSYSGAKARPNIAAGNELNRHCYKNPRSQQTDFVGEVINMDDIIKFGEDTSNAGQVSFSPLKVEQGSTARISGTARKLFFGSSSSSDFPAQVKSDSDTWFLLGDHHSSSNKRKLDYFDSNLKNCEVHQEQPKGILHEGIEQNILSNSQNLPWLEKEKVQHCGTPLWNAVHTNESPRESPWTIEFLNRIKEKSRLRQQSLPCGLSGIGVGSSRNIPKATKRKSPSILEYYKYQGDGIGKRTSERKRQKRSVQLSQSLKKEKASASILPSWTPVDKRAKQTLSFATSGNETQSKLVWSNQSSNARSRRIVPKT